MTYPLWIKLLTEDLVAVLEGVLNERLGDVKDRCRLIDCRSHIESETQAGRSLTFITHRNVLGIGGHMRFLTWGEILTCPPCSASPL